MISVAEALDKILALVTPTEIETVPLADAAGRVLAADIVAKRAQPPFSASAMDGYAVVGTPKPGTRLKLIGEAAAGHRFDGAVGPGQTVRIFTGAPVPAGADRVIIQEDVVADGDVITLQDDLDQGTHIRPAGGDFAIGDRLAAPCRLTPSHVALAASMNHASLQVRRKPVIAVIATGDELVMPGETPRDDQIIASNSFGLKAMFEAAGASVRMLPIAKDTESSLMQVFELAADADMVITIGGASVGDHDLVGKTAQTLGMERTFYKVRMRPGKPLMAGRLGGSVMVGLPGNPVSSMVCGEVFVKPMIDTALGLPSGPRARSVVALSEDLPQNGPREHYMRAIRTADGVRAFGRQDSSLLSVLSEADSLIVRPPSDEARQKGDMVEIISL